ncbi:MAG: T9SS type A sorting domain-containing protein, partial [Bacteroidota bacterium]|nr:T9SS type A sorting domain-containing protein [Bacteroidota bacterium]
TYMEADDPTVANIFSEIENDLQIVKNGAGQVYMPQHSVDLIGSIAIGEAYHLKMIASDSVALIIVGDTVDAANTILNLPATWSYLGYLHDTPQDVTDMMSDISSDIYILKDGAGQAYIPQWSVNNIGNMQPGMGYQIKLTSAHTFTYPAENNSKSLVPVYLADNTEYNAWHTITGNNMTLIIPNYAWADKPMQGDKVKVYDENGVLVGSGLYRDNNMAITIWGDDIHSEGTSGMISKEKFTIVLLRTGEADDFENQTGFFAEEEMLEVENWIAGDDYFETNKVSIAGKIKNTSFINNQTSIILYQNVPNPFSIKTNICFYLPEDANVQISLYNIVGELQEQLVSKEFNKGKHTIEFLSKNYASGTYLYKFTAGNFTATKQLNIMK